MGVTGPGVRRCPREGPGSCGASPGCTWSWCSGAENKKKFVNRMWKHPDTWEPPLNIIWLLKRKTYGPLASKHWGIGSDYSLTVLDVEILSTEHSPPMSWYFFLVTRLHCINCNAHLDFRNIKTWKSMPGMEETQGLNRNLNIKFRPHEASWNSLNTIWKLLTLIASKVFNLSGITNLIRKFTSMWVPIRRRVRVGQTEWLTLSLFTWQPTPVFLPGESEGQRSLVGYGP